MEFRDLNRGVSEEKRDQYQKKYDLDTDTMLLHIKIAYEAAKNLHKEQKRIKKKRTKKTSRELPKCMLSYDESLTTIEEAFKKIDPILTGSIERSNLTSKRPASSSSWNVPKKKERKTVRETFNHNEISECFQCRSKEDFIKRLKEENERLQRNSEDSIIQLTGSLENLQAQLRNLQRKYQEEISLKEDALHRLSKVASSKLRDNNPNITDLSDQNRPTKIAEKLSELYDNQWTDAFDCLEGETEEHTVIQKLLDTLMAAYDTCCKLASRNFFERVQQSMELPAEVSEIPNYKVVLTDLQKQEIKEFRKNRATYCLRNIEKVVRPKLQLHTHQSEVIQEYVSKCVEIGWLCAVQDPPVILDANRSNKFDSNKFKEYTKRGQFVEFVVWPAMILHKDGPLLSKGVAQGSDQPVPDGRFPNQQRKQQTSYTADQIDYSRKKQYHQTDYKAQTTYTSSNKHNQGYSSPHQEHSESKQFQSPYSYNRTTASYEPRHNQYQGHSQGQQYFHQNRHGTAQTMYVARGTNRGAGYGQMPVNNMRSTEI